MRMADYIREDLKARIHAGRDLPPSLTLDGLSRHYGVSFTPVRIAVGALVRGRFLRKNPNGRLVLNPAPPRATASRRPEAPADRERRVTIDALRRSLRGEAVYLREEATAAKYGIGRTVVRQIFARLVGTGLLEHVPRKGWRVRPLLEEDLDAFLVVRETLELKALELARPRLRKADLDRMLAASETALDNDLHRTLIQQSRNRYIRDFFDRHGAFFSTLFDYAAIGSTALAEMSAQHRRILEALRHGKWNAARNALAHHIRCQRPVLKKLMDRLASLPVEKWPDLRRL